jgi:multicomponent Na+:H+ antiporter subunit B
MKPAGSPFELAARSYILRSSVRLFFVALNLFALYLTLKGHNLPGGGFIGGLVSSLSLVMVGMVLGVDEAKRLVRVDPLKLALLGLLLAYGTAAVPILFKQAPLQHFVFDIHWLGVGDLHLLTAQIFDFGVYFVVIGVVTKIVFTFSLSTQLLPHFDQEERAAYAAPDDVAIEESIRLQQLQARRRRR